MESDENKQFERHQPQLMTPSFFEIPVAVDSLEENISSGGSKNPKAFQKQRKQLDVEDASVAFSGKKLIKKQLRLMDRRFLDDQDDSAADHSLTDQELVLKQLRCQNKKVKNSFTGRRSLRSERKEGLYANDLILNQQTCFIERLQQDVCDTNMKLKERDESICCLKVLLDQKDIEIGNLRSRNNKILSENDSQAQEVIEIKDKNNQLLQDYIKLQSDHKETIDKNRNFMRNLEQEHQIQIDRLQADIEGLKTSHVEELKRQEDNFYLEHERLNQNWEEKMVVASEEKDKMACNYQNQLLAEAEKLAKLESALTTKLNEKEVEAEKLQGILHTTEANLKACEVDLAKRSEEVKRLDDELSRVRREDENLKGYIRQLQDDYTMVEEWKTGQEKMRKNIEGLEEEKKDLIKTLEILNIRFDSASKILEMQEAAIAHHVEEVPQEYNQNKLGAVIQAWRKKVFQLMVQLKSQEISIRELSCKHKVEISKLQKAVKEVNVEKRILDTRLEDGQAQLALNRLQLDKAKEKNVEQEKENEKLKSLLDVTRRAMREVGGKVVSLNEIGMKMEEVKEVCVRKLLRDEERINFANNRLKTVMELVKRNASRDRMRSRDRRCEDELAEVRCRLDEVVEERDLLRHKMTSDGHVMEGVRARAEALDRDNQHLRLHNDKLDRKIQDIGAELERSEEKVRSAKEEKRVMSDVLHEKELLFKKELAEVGARVESEMEVKMEEEKTKNLKLEREMAKMVLSLRQTERSSVRERSRLSEQQEEEKKCWEEETGKLRREICELKKDNTMLMASLRQEGIPPPPKPHHHQRRGGGKHVSFGSSSAETASGETFVIEHDRKATPQPDDEDDIGEMLRSLKDLSEQVLHDRDE